MIFLTHLFLLLDVLKELTDLDSLRKGCENVACHIGIEACIMLLTSSLFIAAELIRCRLIISEHQVIADTLVFLTSIVEV